MNDWNYQHKITERLVEELLDVIHKYDETMVVATAIGCLDVVKAQLIADVLEGNEDD
jgi:hypothetical protein